MWCVSLLPSGSAPADLGGRREAFGGDDDPKSLRLVFAEFAESIDGFFREVRQNFKGAVGEFEFQEAMREFLKLSPRDYDVNIRKRLHQLFTEADIIKDGKMLGGEIQYLQYLVREALLIAMNNSSAHAGRTRRTAAEDYFAMLDKNKDSKIDKDELERGAPKQWMRTPAQKAINQAFLRQLFAKADADGDGVLVQEELDMAYAWLLRIPF